jgi:hypothetical protein
MSAGLSFNKREYGRQKSEVRRGREKSGAVDKDESNMNHEDRIQRAVEILSSVS